VKPNSFSIVGSFIRGDNEAEETINNKSKKSIDNLELNKL